MNQQIAIKAIMVKLALAGFEQTQHIYMKEPVLIGRNVNGAVHCTGISKSSEGGFYMTAIFNEKPSDLYGNDFDFTFIRYSLDGDLSYVEPDGDFGIQINPDTISQILMCLDHWGDEWLKYQTALQVTSRRYLRHAMQGDPQPLTWQEKLERISTKAIIEKLNWNRKKNSEMEQFMQMEAMGETKWNEKMDAENLELDEIANNVIGRLKSKMI